MTKIKFDDETIMAAERAAALSELAAMDADLPDEPPAQPGELRRA